MLMLLAVVTARGLRAATRSGDSFTAILAAGLSISFGLQAFLILGGVMRLFPLTGIPVPLVSYGGSSLLTTAFALGMILRISAAPGARPRLAASIRRLHAVWLLALATLAIAAGWWAVVRAPSLDSLPENPRRAGEFREVPGRSRTAASGPGPGEGVRYNLTFLP